MVKRSRQQEPVTKESSKVEIPFFYLECIRSDYPNHLVPGSRYKIKPDNKDNEGNVMTYQYIIEENKWMPIGVFKMSCFDLKPVKQWIETMKGKKKCQS